MHTSFDFWAVVADYPVLAVVLVVIVIALLSVAVIGGLMLCWVAVSRIKRVVRETETEKTTIEFSDG